MELKTVKNYINGTWMEAAGSAYLAGLATGVWKSPAELDQIRRTDCRFEPQMDSSRREALCEGWREAVSRVRSSDDD